MKLSSGYYQAFGAYFTWGIFPIYWKYLSHISALEVLVHRMIWSFAFLLALSLYARRFNFRSLVSQLRSQLFFVLLMALFISTNWIIYVHAVNTGQILQGSLAYFMTPLLNILLGAWIFQERLSVGMKVATSIAGVGVFILIALNSTVPWIAISLAVTFALYGVLKKKSPLGGMESSLLESSLMVIPALLGAFSLRAQSELILRPSDWFLFVGGGAITSIPILLFSLSARKIPFNHVGVLQFLAPTLQFFIGYFLYHEPISNAKLFAFIFVWIGVGIYMTEILKQKQT